MNLKYISAIILTLFVAHSVKGQVQKTANDFVPAYSSEVFFGTNMGYFPGWTDEDLAIIAKGDPIKGVEGIGAETMRPALFGHFLEQWGYEARIKAFQFYIELGLKDIVCFIGEPSKEQRETEIYCPDAGPSNHYKNLYEPIWDNGENGTAVNENNYFALYVYKTVSLYKDYVKIWEIWNEPDLADRDFKGHSLAPPGTDGNWWENNPDPCEYKMRAPVFHYIRTLRIAYEVIKSIQPKALVATGGVGYPSFIDAVCRNTDNPTNGKVDPNLYPLKGGAYFDVLSFHCYPHIDGSLKKWNTLRFKHDLFRHTDKAAQGVIDAKNRFQNVLYKYGYNGNKYPQKHWIITEVNIPRKSFNEQLGSDEAQRNFIIKSIVLAKKENIRQYHIYNLAEASPHDMQVNLTEFNTMGAYQSLLDIPKYEMELTDGGIAYHTTAQFLNGLTYNNSKTTQLALPNIIDGGVFTDKAGTNTIVLWAKTSIDNSEEANANYAIPIDWDIEDWYISPWDYSRSKKETKLKSNAILLTGSPIFIHGGDQNNSPKESTPLEIILNASEQILLVNYTISDTSYIDIDIVNKKGKRVQSITSQEEKNGGHYTTIVDTAKLESGIYFIRIISSASILVEKFIIP